MAQRQPPVVSDAPKRMLQGSKLPTPVAPLFGRSRVNKNARNRMSSLTTIPFEAGFQTLTHGKVIPYGHPESDRDRRRDVARLHRAEMVSGIRFPYDDVPTTCLQTPNPPDRGLLIGPSEEAVGYRRCPWESKNSMRIPF